MSAAKGYCCAMRARFLLGIVGERLDFPVPVDVADFVIDWGAEEGGKVLMRYKYCPFCAKPWVPGQKTHVVEHDDDDDE